MEIVGWKRKYLSRKNPQNPHLSPHNWKFLRPNLRGFIVDEVWWAWHMKWWCISVVKQDWKNGKDLNNICSKEVLGKDINWFAETYITTIKTLKDPFYNKVLLSFDNSKELRFCHKLWFSNFNIFATQYLFNISNYKCY